MATAEETNVPATASAGQVPATTSLTPIIERVMTDPNMDLDRLERFMQLRECEEARERELREKEQYKADELDFRQAKARAQAAMDPVRKDLYNNQTKSRYASYAALDETARPHYTGEGFSISFNTALLEGGGMVEVTAHLQRGPFAEPYSIPVPIVTTGAKGGAVMTPVHALKSAVSYGRRILLEMIWNLSSFDDDGNAAWRREEPEDDQLISDKDVLKIQTRISAISSDPEATLFKILQIAKVDQLEDLRTTSLPNLLARLDELEALKVKRDTALQAEAEAEAAAEMAAKERGDVPEELGEGDAQ